MRRFRSAGSLFLVLIAAFPAAAGAETFLFQRDVFPPPLGAPSVVGIELPPDVRREGGFRIVSERLAVPFRADGIARDLLPDATIVSAPAAADTYPRTTVDMVRGEGVFRPVTAPELRFAFEFAENVTPAELVVDLAGGSMEAIEVFGGLSSDAMHRLYAGAARSGDRVALPGDAARVVELTIHADRAVAIDSIRLLDQPRFLFFQAEPGARYVLLSGATDTGLATLFPGYQPPRDSDEDTTLLARLGPPTPVSERDDHDGIREADNCPDRWNLDQRDADGDGLGDACDPCPSVRRGADADDDGLCDPLEDPDADGIPNMHDNCPAALNRLQEDLDGDGVGDACDPFHTPWIAMLKWLPLLGIGVAIVAYAGSTIMRKRSGKVMY